MASLLELITFGEIKPCSYVLVELLLYLMLCHFFLKNIGYLSPFHGSFFNVDLRLGCNKIVMSFSPTGEVFKHSALSFAC